MTWPRAVQRFLTAARELGAEPDVTVHERSSRTAAEAADTLGCAEAQIVKSLVFLADGEPLLVLTAGDRRVDTDRLGAWRGAAITRADADAVRTATGFAIGGTPPFGHVSTLATVVDRSLLVHDTVYAAAGTPESTFPLEPAELVRLSGAQVGDFAS